MSSTTSGAATRTSADRTSGHRGATAPLPTSRIDPIRVLRQHQWKLLIAAVLGVAVGGAAKVLFDNVYPLYTGTVLFELRPGVTDASKTGNTEDRTEEIIERLGQTEAARLMSRSLLETAMRNREIETTKWSQKFLDENGKFVLEDAVDELEKDLSAAHRRRTQYFALSWSTNEAQDIPIVLNQIARTYIQAKNAQDDLRFSKNLVVFNAQRDAIDEQLINSQREINKFITEHEMTSSNSDASDITNRLEELGRNIGITKGDLSIAKSRKQSAEAKLQGRLEPSSDDLRKADEDPIIIRQIGTLNELKIQLESSRSYLGETHPEFRKAVRLVEAAQATLDISRKKIVDQNLNADFKDFSDQEAARAELLDKYEKDYAKFETRLQQFTANQSELEEKKDRQKRLQESRSEAIKMISDLNSLKVREDARAVTIAVEASTPREKSFPRWSIMLPLGGVLGLLLMLGFAFLRELLDQRVRYSSDLTGLGARLLGTVPDVEDDPTGVKRAENAIREAPQSVVAESLRQASLHILKQIKSGSHRTVLVTGGMPEAGVTAILTNLAESMASAGKRVLLIDANLRKPGLAAALGADLRTPGLGEILAGKTTLDRAAVPIGERIHFLNAGASEHRVFERLATPAMDDLLHQAKEIYDIVLIDSAPAVVAGDAMVLASKVDATLLVVRAFQEQRGLVSRLVHQLHDMPSNFLGIILNRPRYTAGGYFRKNYEAMAKYAGSA